MAIAQVDLLDILAGDKDALVEKYAAVLRVRALEEIKPFADDLEKELRIDLDKVINLAVKKATDPRYLKKLGRKISKWFKDHVFKRR